MWEWVAAVARRGGKLFWIELFVPGGTLIVLTILLAGLVMRYLRSGGASPAAATDRPSLPRLAGIARPGLQDATRQAPMLPPDIGQARRGRCRLDAIGEGLAPGSQVS